MDFSSLYQPSASPTVEPAAQPSPPSQPPKPSQPLQPSSPPSLWRIAAIAGALALFFAFVVWKVAPIINPPPVPKDESITLTVWTTRDDEAIYRVLGQEYQKSHPNVKIQYQNQNLVNYRLRVQTQIDNKQGPDIFMIHSSWIPTFLLSDALYPAPSDTLKFNEFNKIYYPLAKDTLTRAGKGTLSKTVNIYGIPLEVDGLALFYNEDILRAGAQNVPSTWAQFQESAIALTVKSEDGSIKTAGAAMGTTNNVDHWEDIIGLLFNQQPGASLSNLSTKEASEVIKFYTNFANPPDAKQKVWDGAMEDSTQAFASGRLAFYLGPAYRVREFAANPDLKFKTAPVPQLPNQTGGNVGWGSFWALSVSNSSKYPEAAWEFLQFISEPDTQRLIFDTASQVRIFGEPFARMDMKDDLKEDPWLGTFVKEAPTYRTWYLASKTQDQGINAELSREFAGVIKVSLSGQDTQSALQAASPRIQTIIDTYTKPVTQATEE